MAIYDPFAAGQYPVAVRSMERSDEARGRRFPIEIWQPGQVSTEQFPLVIFSHASGNHRRGAIYLCSHLASHGYVVASMDHSEVVAPELRFRANEAPAERAARGEAVIRGRIPDVHFLLEQLREGDGGPIGMAGHSFGGWTALAMVEEEPRVSAVVALAPGGASHPRPGILPLKLAFAWDRDVPTLYLAAENDACLPLSGMYELLERTPAAKRMVILQRSDHLHFLDDAEAMHESFRKAELSGDLAAIQRDMLPMAELCAPGQAHLFARGLATAHFDAVLKGREEAQEFWAGDWEGALAARGVDAKAAAFR